MISSLAISENEIQLKVITSSIKYHQDLSIKISKPKIADSTQSVYDTKFFTNLLGRAFRAMKNGVYLVVVAVLVAELFKIMVYDL